MNFTEEQKAKHLEYRVKRRNLNNRLRLALLGRSVLLDNEHYQNSHTKAGKCFLGGFGNVFNKTFKVFGY